MLGNGTGSSYRIQEVNKSKLSNTGYPSSPHLPAACSSFAQSGAKIGSGGYWR